ncbi:methionyl-tRNA formyltransferase [Microaerobacter geothermalis]|nr:methionyl-tRNA formyltransferase [Microaerobacter geothermalis]
MGTPDFAVPCLERLVKDFEVVAVVTQPDRPKGRKRELTPSPVKVTAIKHKIPVFQPEKLRDSTELEQVIQLNPDLIVTAAYGQILPKKLLDTPPYGCINVHASLLPKYRGGAPIHRAIINGEKETGVTIMYMAEKLDAGDMLSRVVVPIEETDTVGSLHNKLSEVGARLLMDTIPKLIKGEVIPVPQDHSLATFAPNIKREDEWIDWDVPVQAIFNQVRGLNPWPVAYTTLQGEIIKIWWGEAIQSSLRGEPGEIIMISEEGMDVATKDGQFRVLQLQPAGKRKMSIEEYVRGAGSAIVKGMKLGT